jgi:cytochrome oxidase Cu insertion factor (SCO1/SenC/PrrC family)
VAPDDDFAGPTLADFELIDQTGARVTRADLSGRPLIVDFVFTTCSGPCPAMSAGMAELQQALGAAPVTLVSVSVDPARDTPEALAGYAEALGAEPGRWRFLTGDEDQIVTLATSLHLGVARATPPASGEVRLGEQVTHSTKFVVLDAEGVVRGYYDGQSADGRRAAVARALYLAR